MTILLLGAVPLAGISAYVLAGRLTRHRGVRVWAALTYALLPPLTGAVAAGRLGTAILGWLLPLVVLLVLRAVTVGSRWTATWLAVLALAAAEAFVPLMWLATAVLAVAVLAVGIARRGITSVWRGRGATARLLAMVAVPPLLLLPWSWDVATHPARLWLEAGAPAPGTIDPELPSWVLALAQPGGPVAGGRWLLVGTVIAALASLVRRDRRRPVVLGWAVALVGLALAQLALVLRIPGVYGSATSVAAWPGAATLLVGGGLVAAAIVGGDGLRSRLSASTFGWRQPVTFLIVILALAGTTASAVTWVSRGADDPLTRAPATLLPPFVAASNAGPLHPRALLLSADVEGHVLYSLLSGSGPELGDAELAPPAGSDGGLGQLVSGLAAGVEDATGAQRLATYGIGSIVALRPVPPTVALALDATPGLQRAATTPTTFQWRLLATPGRVRLVTPGAPTRTLALSTSTPSKLTATVPDGPTGRRVVVADAADSRWHATLAGTALKSSKSSWSQAFSLPAGSGELVIAYDSVQRRNALAVQGLLVAITVILALPARRRTDDFDDDLPPEPLHSQSVMVGSEAVS